MKTILISCFVVAATVSLICVWLETLTEKLDDGYEEMEQDPGICYALTVLTLPFLMGMVMTGAPVIFFAVLAVISTIDWVSILRKPSSWRDFAFMNAIVDILAVLILVSG